MTNRRLGFRALVGSVLGASVAAWTAAFVATVAGSLDRGVAAVGLAAGLVAGLLAARATLAPETGGDEGEPGRDSPSRSRGGPIVDVLALVAFGVVSVRQFGWLVFERVGELRTLIANNYGDLPLHWTYVEFLAAGAPFWPENPIVAGERLRYPFAVDLLTSQLVVLGLGMRVLLPLIGLAGAAATAFALRRWGGALAVAGFLFSGGLAGFEVLWTGRLVDYQDAVAWKNLFLALFVPQRGLLLAVPVGLLLLWSWRRRLLRGEPALAPWVEGLLWGTLPLVHLHTFLVVSLLWAVWSLGAGRLRVALPSLAWAAVPATWSVWQVGDGFRAASLVGWAPGWTIGAANPLAFLLVNFGLFLPLAIAALVIAWRQRRREHLLVLAPALVFFGALFVVRVAPWAWDNTKVMLWCYLLALPSIGALVLDRLSWPLRASAVVGLLFSGAVCVTAASVGERRLEVLDVAEHDAVCRALHDAALTERVATAPTFNHPVALCGHPIVAGYAGHLWSHGIDGSRVNATLETLMLGQPGWRDAARGVGAGYVFWGHREATEWAASTRPWESGAPAVARGSWGALYRVN